MSVTRDLELDQGTFLSTPAFFSGKQRPRVRVRSEDKSAKIEIDPEDATRLRVTNLSSGEVISTFQPYTGGIINYLLPITMFDLICLPSGWGEAKPLTSLASSCGRLAVLTRGRVFVYSEAELVTPDPRVQEALLLAATRRLQPPVTGLHLAPSLLVTVGGDTITTFNFWTKGCSSVSEFFM